MFYTASQLFSELDYCFVLWGALLVQTGMVTWVRGESPQITGKKIRNRKKSNNKIITYYILLQYNTGFFPDGLEVAQYEKLGMIPVGERYENLIQGGRKKRGWTAWNPCKTKVALTITAIIISFITYSKGHLCVCSAYLFTLSTLLILFIYLFILNYKCIFLSFPLHIRAHFSDHS